MTAPRPQELVEHASTLAACDGCVAVATHTEAASLRWANGTLTSNGVAAGLRLTVVALRGSAVGVASCEGAGAGDVEPVVRRAEAVAVPASDLEPLVAGVPASDDWDEDVAGTSIHAFEALVPPLADAAARLRTERRLLAGYASHTAQSTFLASSTGLRLRHDDAWGSIELTAATADRSRSAWVGASTRDFAEVDVAELERQLRQRLAWSSRRVELRPGAYEALLPPAAVADLMVHLYASADARGALDGRTPFGDGRGGTRVGDRVSSVPLTLRSDPAELRVSCRDFVVSPGASESSVFDNGLPLEPTRWISDGTLSALVQTRSSAAASGLPVTPWIDNVILDGTPGGRSLDDMVASTDEGLLLTCLWYLREVDPSRLLLTGVTRDGTFLVRGGEVVGAVGELRFHESPFELLGRIREVGRTQAAIGRGWGDLPRTAMPPLRVDGFRTSEPV